MEHLRAEIIVLGVRIKEAVATKGEADAKIRSDVEFLNAIKPEREESLEQLYRDREETGEKLERLHGLFSEKKKTELQEKMEMIDAQISLREENAVYADQASGEIKRLRKISREVGRKIQTLKDSRRKKELEYEAWIQKIPDDQIKTVKQQCLEMRKYIEVGVRNEEQIGEVVFRGEARVNDIRMTCLWKNEEKPERKWSL